MVPIQDFELYVCQPELPIREVMHRIDLLPVRDKFQIVVNEHYQVLGTVTDGDIRRGLLRGHALSDRVDAAMHVSMHLGKKGENEANLAQLKAIESNVPFLPIVDASGRLCEIIVPGNQHAAVSRNVHALVQAGGFGTRLGPRTRDVPKPLLPIGGRPILDYILERLERSGVSKVWLSVHYLPEQIENFIANRDNKTRVSILREEYPLGTAGSISLIPENDFLDLLVVNGDVLTQLDFDTFMNFHQDHRNEATVAAAMHEVKIPFGVIQYAENGSFNGINEKPTLRHFVSAGINIFSRNLCNLVAKDEVIDMPDLIHRGKSLGMSVGVFPMHEYWTDVGTPEDFAKADKAINENET
jgi:dTDP-glucose pyrophosphorylase